MPLSDHVQFVKDRAKRFGVDMARNAGRLQTPMDLLLATLAAHGFLPGEMHALEVFGMHGLWHTRDYFPLCRSLELYEVNPVYARYASKGLPGSRVLVADSIRAVREHRLLRPRYTFIVLDNPFTQCFGGDYAEHFDLFPEVLDYLAQGVLVLNFIHDPSRLPEDLRVRRRAFYGRERPTIPEAVDFYTVLFRQAGLKAEASFFVPRNPEVAYLAFPLTPR